VGRRSAAAPAAVYLIWGSTYLAIKYLVTGFPPFLGTGIRFLVAGAVLYPVARRRAPGLTRSQWWSAVQLGALLLVGGTGLVTVAESTGVGSGLAATAVAAMPLWAGLIGGAMGRWPSPREWSGLVVGMAGVALLGLGGDFSSNPAGAIILLAAPISWALGSMRRNRIDLPSGLVGVSAEMLAGGGLLLVLGVLRGERLVAVPPLEAWLGLAYLIVFGSIVAFSAYMYLLGAVRPALATSYAYVNPVVAVVLGLTVGAESLTGRGLAALPLILGGVALVTGVQTGEARRWWWRRRPAADAALCEATAVA
jgi:drug/metabolite transporter (DMT)-like permease